MSGKTLRFPDNFPVSDDVLVELGRIPALWGSLENFLDICIHKLVGTERVIEPRIAILISHAGFQQKVQMLEALCDYLSEEYPSLRSYRSVATELKGAAASRNQFMHSGVFYDEERKSLVTLAISARSKLKWSQATVDINDIVACSRKIHDAQRSLYKLVLGKSIDPMYSNRA
ncbi:MAG TPA: hypothetical protein VFJ13_09895 [Paracoccaceae bacterium]|nr:hypothetical protein [Paracoccaceae bacterium]